MAHQNDVGTKFIISIKDDGLPVDLTNALSRQIFFKKPSDSVITRSAYILQDGSAVSGIMYYDTVLGDLDEVGFYKLQGKIITGSGTYSTDLYTFKVNCNLE